MSATSLTAEERQLLSPEDLELVERLLSFDHGPVYPYEHPPGDFCPIDGVIDFDEWFNWEGPP